MKPDTLIFALCLSVMALATAITGAPDEPVAARPPSPPAAAAPADKGESGAFDHSAAAEFDRHPDLTRIKEALGQVPFPPNAGPFLSSYYAPELIPATRKLLDDAEPL